MRVIAATGNEGKVREISKILGNLGIEVISQRNAGIKADIEETGSTFEENAIIKAKAISMLCDNPVIADDSGLCVDALGGAPGVYSARFAGEGASDEDRINKLLSELDGKDDRKAKFVSSVAFVTPDGKVFTATGEVEGKILTEAHGSNGFGYDPVFYSFELNKTFAEASADEKNKISHRGRALTALYEQLKEIL